MVLSGTLDSAVEESGRSMLLARALTLVLLLQLTQGAANPPGGPFLIPLLPYGLSNQVLALKEALALAAVLNWTVVPIGFWPHSSELAAAGLAETGEGKPGRSECSQAPVGGQVMSFDLVFDRSALSPLVRVLSYEDARQRYGLPSGGRPDAVLSISPMSGLDHTLAKARAVGLVDASGMRVARNNGFKCDARGLAWLASAAAGKRWVVLFAYRRVVPPARSSYRSFANDTSPCARAYHQVSLRLSKSPVIASAAQDWLDAALSRVAPQQAPTGGGSGSTALPYYVALHVRPYPDPCMDYFVGMTAFDPDAAKKVCRNPLLLANMVPRVRRHVAQHAAEGRAVGRASVPVFVMAHPRVRDVVRREVRRLWAESVAEDHREGTEKGRGRQRDLMKAVAAPPLGPTLLFLDVADMPAELRHQAAANSLLSMVEQEVCRTADVFLGTAASSISVMVAQERVAANGERPGPQRVTELL
ncbi:hypothetical protein HYH03_017909 [Edaphochlamys debaryana]|uniref:O-fucosyltransferase family protein n=1 Tax=Edaphochlamys debaryana TaxID=47281 RepID=A0A835XGB6_9CHLO|nr:hypothetical protein HYH03_017909 [Edaphochlamys debaryana]|eukprot:KAG2483211.1 hypothetical protein HYH03_017909 [Edaphochlamys debaryana]